MSQAKSLTVVIAAKNEERQIYNTIRTVVHGFDAAKLEGREIIVVNDGSSDGTARIVEYAQKQYPYVRLINHSKNKGIGASFIAGVNAATCSHATFFAGDNNANAQLAEVMFSNIEKADIIVSFFVNVESRNRKRIVLSTLYSLIYSATFGLYIQYINGNSIYPVSLLKSIGLRADSYSIWAEILTKCLRSGGTYYEVPGYANPDCSRSQAMSIKSTLKVVTAYFKLFWKVKIIERKRYNDFATRAHVPPYKEYPITETQPSSIIENSTGNKNSNSSYAIKGYSV